MRLDRCLGWEPGSSAAVLLGGKPLTVTARAAIGEALTPARSWTGCCPNCALKSTRPAPDVGALLARLDRLEDRLDHLANEFDVDEDLLQQFNSGDASSSTGS